MRDQTDLAAACKDAVKSAFAARNFDAVDGAIDALVAALRAEAEAEAEADAGARLAKACRMAALPRAVRLGKWQGAGMMHSTGEDCDLYMAMPAGQQPGVLAWGYAEGGCVGPEPLLYHWRGALYDHVPASAMLDGTATIVRPDRVFVEVHP